MNHYYAINITVFLVFYTKVCNEDSIYSESNFDPALGFPFAKKKKYNLDPLTKNPFAKQVVFITIVPLVSKSRTNTNFKSTTNFKYAINIRFATANVYILFFILL